MKNNDILIHNIASKFIMNENVNIEIKGKKNQLECLNSLLDVSKQLYESLNQDNQSLNNIMSLIEQKNKLADEFYKITNIKWKL